MMPNFVGEWFPRKDVPQLQDYYCASMLALLTPRTDIGQLKSDSQSFKQAYDEFMSKADEQTIHIVDNIQYHYECTDSAQRKHEKVNTDNNIIPMEGAEPEDGLSVSALHEFHTTQGIVEYNQQDVDNTLAAQFSHEEKLFADVAVNIAFDHGIFNEEKMSTCWKDLSKSATDDDLIRFQELERMVKAVTKNKMEPDRRGDINPVGLGSTDESVTELGAETMPDIVADRTHTDVLNGKQLKAHDIVMNHLIAHLDGKRPKQVLMMVTGQGGTGKSTLLNAITTTFEKVNAHHLLGKTALSGVAASLVGGTTLHWFGGLPLCVTPQSDIWPDNPSKHIRERRNTNLQPILWLAIDEMGMCTLDLLTLLSQVAGKARVDDGRADATVPFGGLNVIMMGDFHQFPPVGASNAALYCPPVARNTATVGKAIYLQFETVIDLVQQWRITDKEWMNILARSRDGECTKQDIHEIRKLIITNPECDVPDFDSEPWNTATLVTPRNCVRTT
jgi:hypothetical protein